MIEITPSDRIASSSTRHVMHDQLFTYSVRTIQYGLKVYILKEEKYGPTIL